MSVKEYGPSMVIHVCDEAKKCKSKVHIMTLERMYVDERPKMLD